MLNFLLVALLQFLALVAPGPDFATLVKNSLLYDKRTAVYTALGISLGIVVHVTYCILGFAVVISKSVIVFNIIKFLGAGYLIYLGIKSILTKQDQPVPTENIVKVTSISKGQALRQGFFCNALNPKASLFFLGLFTLVIHPDTLIYVQLFYGFWMVLTTFIWFAFLATVITHPRTRERIFHIQPTVIKVMGFCLIAFGIRLLFIHHS